MTINSVVLKGRLALPPRWTPMQSGALSGELVLATDERQAHWRTGRMLQRVEWHRIVLQEALAAALHDQLRKNDLVEVRGRLQTRRWCDGGRATRYRTVIVAEAARLLGMSGPAAPPQLRATSHDDAAIAAWVAEYDRGCARMAGALATGKEESSAERIGGQRGG